MFKTLSSSSFLQERPKTIKTHHDLQELTSSMDFLPLKDFFPDKQLLAMEDSAPRYADLVNYLVTNRLPIGLSQLQRHKLKRDARNVWDEPFLWKHCVDQMLRRCVPNCEFHSILNFCHSYACGGHFGAKRTALKVLECGFYLPTLFKDAYLVCKSCDRCQRVGNLGAQNQMPQTPILVVEIFDVWV